jgi:hypothetical protein
MAKTIADPECGVCTCSFSNSKREKCTNVRVTNNIVAGATWVGMTLQGFRCGKPETNLHYGNVVHSVANSKGGLGVAIHPDYYDRSQTKTCFEGSGAVTYKNTAVGTVF